MELSAGVILLLLFIAAFIVQAYYYLAVFRKFAWYKEKGNSPSREPVTVIICAKNEEENLRKYLPLVLEQDYPEFEVIVVNDCSRDGTRPLLEELEKKYKHLRIITIKEEGVYNIGKKYPLTLGIKGAKYEQMVLTDADCYPRSKHWLAGMAAHFSPSVDIVLGYGAYEKHKGFLNKLIRFDTFFTALQYFSLALCGRPYMGVGRNLAYKNSLFFKNKGFATHNHIPSGDDDLFINRAATGGNTAIEISPEAHTLSLPKRTLKDWMLQKRRHMTTGRFYKPADKLTLGAIYFSRLLLYGCFFALLALKFALYLILLLFFLRITIQLVIFNKSMQKLKEKDLLPLAPLLEAVMLFLYPLLAILSLFTKKHKWN